MLVSRIEAVGWGCKLQLEDATRMSINGLWIYQPLTECIMPHVRASGDTGYKPLDYLVECEVCLGHI